MPNSCRVSAAALFHGRGWQQRVELIDGGGRQAGEGVFEPCPGVEAELLAGGGETRQSRQSSAAMVVAEKELVAAADRVKLYRPFSQIVVDGQSAVGDIDVPRGPPAAGIGDRFAQRTLWQRGDGERIEPPIQRRQLSNPSSPYDLSGRDIEAAAVS